MSLANLNMVDLYIGHGYCDYTASVGDDAVRSLLPANLTEEVELLAAECARLYGADVQPEFALEFGGVRYRVTATMDVANKAVFVLNRASATLRKTSTLGHPPHIRELILSSDTSGLVLLAGSPGSGKTTAAGSYLVERLERNGGRAWAIEDPPELMLDGEHGKGRCTQVPVSRRAGGYGEQLIRAVRARIKTILIGEIRDPLTAREVVLASNNGHLIISTIHADTVANACRRVIELAEGAGITNGAAMLADGLAAVIHQKLQRPDAVTPNRPVAVIARTLSLRHQGTDAIRSRIRESRLDLLQQDVLEQANRSSWQ